MSNRQHKIFTNVDFPDPVVPIIPNLSPLFISKFRFLNISLSLEYEKLTS